MKILQKYFTLVGFLIVSTQLIAGPAMNVITINTADAMAYNKWLEKSTPTFDAARGDLVAASGICSPISGAEQEGDHYVWAIAPSMKTLLQSQERLYNDAASTKAIARISSKRSVVKRAIFEIIKSGKTPYKTVETNAQYNLLSKPNDVSKYVQTIAAMEEAAAENGFEDIQMVVFEGFGAGDWARMVMASVQAPSVERLGAFLDEMRSPWMAESMSAFPSLRTPVHDWQLLCRTISASN